MKDIIENRDVAIKISGVKKQYKLGQIGGGTLQADLQSWWAKKRGKEDPNSKIGQDQKDRLVGQSFMALNGIDLTVYKGEALGIIGGNGAGKSTLLKLLSRVTAPTEGQIELYGRVTSMLEVGTGFNGEMTGRENIYMNGAILGMTKAEIDAKMEEIIEFSEVRDFIDTPVKRYSSGMYVKLAFSVAAHLDSEIMIMDEVLAVGDMAFQKKCLDKMSKVATQDGKTVLYVSHNMNTIRRLCTRCVVLDKGRIVYVGETEKAIQIYMNCKNTEKSTFVDLTNMPRENPKQLAVMKSFELLENTNCIYQRGEKIRFALKWTPKKDFDNMRFWIEIYYLDESPVGLIQSDDLGRCVGGIEQTAIFEFDTDLLAEGNYYFSIALYQRGDNGNYAILDQILRANSVEIISTDDEKTISWSHRWWGSIMFPNMKVLKKSDR